ncbi:hypothetical protein C922_03844 [Plasmodium inui San Antonio 1]|uniref:Uncharacterized protein n=1 Tax=Plasmodium inui San Antonio 1 TaxID=1237626 RepID=W7AKK2_9APIC|nr:hypothetical protein C922_03844 [Plasmodium inui San Antonio 1]EUD65861.1 hypothetical protein C922_03844 [Plasmodium inui San Antonio 1]
MQMKNSCRTVLNLLKGKKHPLNAKEGGCQRRYSHNSCSIVEKKKKVSTHISYSLPAQRENEKYTFEVLMKTMKNRADEYNLIKIKEAQNKILIHLNTFTTNQVISTLVLSHKYNMLNFKILHTIIEHLFRHSCFLNSRHLYVLVSIVRKIHLENLVHPSQQDNHESTDHHNAHVDGHLDDVNENIKWKEKYYGEVMGNLALATGNETSIDGYDLGEAYPGKHSGAQCPLEYNGTLSKHGCNRGSVSRSLPPRETHPVEENLPLQNCPAQQEDFSVEMEDTHLKIKEILTHNYSNIYLNIKKNMYTSLLLLNYLHEENIISRTIFLKIIYSINTQFSQHTFSNNKNRGNSGGHSYDANGTYEDNILNSYLQDQCQNTSAYDLYIHLHFHLLKNMLTECEFINNKFVMEKIENGTSINEDVYRDAKLYLEVFSLFFQNMERVTEMINHLKVFHLNVLSHELFKLLCDNSACKNVKIYYSLLNRVSCESILKMEATPDVCYSLLSVLCYLKREDMLNCEIRPFGYPPSGEPAFDLQKIQDRYSLFLNSLNQYTLHDFIIAPHEAKEAINTNDDIPIKRTPNGEPPTIEESPHSLRYNFLAHFMAEFTFNVVCSLNRIDSYEQLFILKYLILLNLKNEYLIDVLKERQCNFFIQRKHYSDRKHFFYFIEYLLTSFIYSIHEFLNLIHLIDLPRFQIVLDTIKPTKKFTNKVKKIFDALNVILNQRKHYYVGSGTKKKVRNNQFEKNSTVLPEDTTQVQRFQNIIYDFLFL